MLQNPDPRPLPPGCTTHLDAERQDWYYVHLQADPPRVTYTHPADESSHFPARSPTPQQQQPFRQSTYGPLENSLPQQHMPLFQNPTVQQQRPAYGNRSSSFRQSTSSVQEYAPHQNPSPPVVNNPSSIAMNHNARYPAAQNIYAASIPQGLQTPSDNRFSIYSTNSHGTAQEVFDASILYSSPMSTSPQAVSPIFQPQRRRMSLDGPESFTASPSNPATNHARSQSVQVSNPATQFPPHKVLRRKTKTAAALPAIPQPPPPPKFQQPREVPVYSLVAQAPLDTTAKPTTPSFQTILYPKLPIPDSINPGALQPRKKSLPPSNQLGLVMSQYPSAATTTLGSMTIPQQSLSPLRAQNTGGPPAIPSASYVNSQVPSLMHTTSQPVLGLTNGLVNPTSLAMNHTPSLMSMSSYPRPDGFSNGLPIPPVTFNQPQSNGSMTLSGAPLISPTMIPPQAQQPSSFSNGLDNNALAQSMLLQQSRMLSDVPQMQVGMNPGVLGQPTANSAAPMMDSRNKQLMKKVGKSLGKAVLRFGVKYALEQTGVDQDTADSAVETVV